MSHPLRLLLFAVLLLWPGLSAAQTAHVKSQSNRVTDAGHTTHTLTVTSGMTNSGDTGVGAVSWKPTTSNLTGVTVCGNTATLLDNPIAGSTVSGAGYVFAGVTSGACNIVATWDANVTESRVLMHEASGVDTSTPVGSSHVGNAQTNPGTGTDAITSTAITPPDNGRYIFGATANSVGACTATASTSFTGAESSTTRVSEYKIQSTAASIAATFTGCNDVWVTEIIALKAAGGAGRNLLLLGVGQ